MYVSSHKHLVRSLSQNLHLFFHYSQSTEIQIHQKISLLSSDIQGMFVYLIFYNSSRSQHPYKC